MKHNKVSIVCIMLLVGFSVSCLAQNKRFTVSSGTGFALSSRGYIATNYHVVEGAISIEVKGIGGSFTRKYTAEVVAFDKLNDLAIIKIKDTSFTSLDAVPYIFRNSIAETGENVFTLGYPLTEIMGEEIKLTNGIINSNTGFQDDISCFQISVPIQPGNSGGPLFDKSGYLIGVTSSGINHKLNLTENVNYAVKINYLKKLINNSLSQKIILAKTNLLASKSISEQAKIAKKFIYQILINHDKSKINTIWADYFNKAYAAMDIRDIDNAKKYFELMLGIKPEKDAQIYSVLGTLYDENKDLAFSFYKKSIELQPEDNAQAYLGIGRILRLKGFYDNAISYLDKAIKSGEDADAYFQKGCCYFSQGDELGKNGNINDKIIYYEKALDCIKYALKLNSNHTKANQLMPGLYFILANSYISLLNENNDLYKVKSYCNKAIEYLSYINENKQLGIAYKARGICNFKLSNKSEGLSDFQKAARLGNIEAQEALSKSDASW